MTKKNSITPHMLRRNGGVAIRIREAMERKGMDVHALNRAIGLRLNSTTPYTWIKARGFPGKDLQLKLAEALDLDVKDFTPENADAKPSEKKPSRALVPVKSRSPVLVPVNRVETARELLSIQLMDDGTLRMDAKRGLALLGELVGKRVLPN